MTFGWQKRADLIACSIAAAVVKLHDQWTLGLSEKVKDKEV